MSGPKITFNSTLQGFNNYINTPGANLRGVTIQQAGSKLKFSEGGFPYVPLFRNAQDKINNNRARFIFYNAVCEQFGGKENVPDSVKKALCLKDYGNIETCDNLENFLMQGSGKPLSYSRIQTVLNAVKKAMKADPKMYADNIIRGLREIRLDNLNGGQEKIKTYLMAQFDKLFPKSAFQNKDCINVIKKNIETLSQSIVSAMEGRSVTNVNNWFTRLVQQYKNALDNLKPDTEKRDFAQGVCDRLQKGVDDFDNYMNEVLVLNQGVLKRLTHEEIEQAEAEEEGRKLKAELMDRNVHHVCGILKEKMEFAAAERDALNFFLMHVYGGLTNTDKEAAFKQEMSHLYEICLKGLSTKKPQDGSELMSLMKGLFDGYFTPEKIKSDWQKSYTIKEAQKAIDNWQPISDLDRLKEIINNGDPNSLTPKETGEKLFKDIWAITYSGFSFETKVNETVKVLNNFVSGILGEEAVKESEDAIYKIAMKFSGERGIIATENTLAEVKDGRELFGELFKSKQLNESNNAKVDGFKEQFKFFVDKQHKNSDNDGKLLSLKFDRTPRNAESIQAFFERHFTQTFGKLAKGNLTQMMNDAGLSAIAEKIAQGGEGFENAKTQLKQCFEDIADKTGAKKAEVYAKIFAQFTQFVDNIIDSNNAEAVGGKAFLDINTLLINENMQLDEKKLAVTVKLKDIVTDLFGKNAVRDSKEEIAEIANELCEKSQPSKLFDGYERLFDFFDKHQDALADENAKQLVGSKIKGLIKGFEKHIPLANIGDKVEWLVEKYGNTVKKASDLQTFMEWHFKSTFKSFDANVLNESLTQLQTITQDIISNKDDYEKFYDGKMRLKNLFDDCAKKMQNEDRRNWEIEVFSNVLNEIQSGNLVD